LSLITAALEVRDSDVNRAVSIELEVCGSRNRRFE